VLSKPKTIILYAFFQQPQIVNMNDTIKVHVKIVLNSLNQLLFWQIFISYCTESKLFLGLLYGFLEHYTESQIQVFSLFPVLPTPHFRQIVSLPQPDIYRRRNSAFLCFLFVHHACKLP
jgi:hypothetical protein